MQSCRHVKVLYLEALTRWPLCYAGRKTVRELLTHLDNDPLQKKGFSGHDRRLCAVHACATRCSIAPLLSPQVLATKAMTSSHTVGLWDAGVWYDQDRPARPRRRLPPLARMVHPREETPSDRERLLRGPWRRPRC